MAQRIDLPPQLHRRGEMIFRGLPQRVRLHRDMTVGVVGDAPVEAAGGTRGAHHPPSRIVGIDVLGAGTVQPADHPPLGVVAEPQRLTRGIDHLGEPSARVVPIADDLNVGLPRRPHHPHRRDQPLTGLHRQPVPPRMVDLRQSAVVGVITQIHTVTVTIDDRGQRQDHAPGTLGRHREVQDMPGRRVRHGIRAILLAG